MPPLIHTFSDEINYLVWRYLRDSSKAILSSFILVCSAAFVQCILIRTFFVDLAHTAWSLETEIKSKTGKDVVAVHEELGKNVQYDLPKRLRMSMSYQEILKHMSEVWILVSCQKTILTN
jgi:hypothetical protein